MAIIVVVSIIIYYWFLKPAPTDTATNGGTLLDVTAEANVGTDVLTLLNQIQSLRIDKSIFESPEYQSLNDFSVAIPPQPVGRPNPFAPIPGFTPPSTTK